MSNYSPSTIARIADLLNGLMVSTGVLAAATYIAQAQKELFTVRGRIKIHDLFSEVSVIFGAQAALVQYNFTSSSPVIAVQPLCAVSASVASLAVGERIAWIGGAVGTAAIITATPGITDIARGSQIVGTDGGVGTIGILNTIASVTSGSFKTVIFWSAMSDGASVEALV
jgi:hypothetical protein